jgi:hypothetical protein
MMNYATVQGAGES